MTNPESKGETTGEPTCASCGHLRLCHVCTASDCSCAGFVPWPDSHSAASSSPDEIPEFVADTIDGAKVWASRNPNREFPFNAEAVVWLADAYERMARRESDLYDKLECAEHELDEARSELQEARADVAVCVQFHRGNASVTNTHLIDVVSRYDKREAAAWIDGARSNQEASNG